MSDKKYQNQDITDFVDIETEIAFLSGMIRNKTIYLAAVKGFQPKYICNERLRFIYDTTVEFYDKHKALLTWQSFKQLKVVSSDEEGIYRTLYQRIVKCKPRTLGKTLAAKEALQKFWTGRTLERGTKGVVKALSKAVGGDAEAVQEALRHVHRMSDQIKAPARPPSFTNPMSGLSEYKRMTKEVRANPDLLRVIQTGIKGVDKSYPGAKRGDFCMVTASTGGGKSMFLLQCAIHCCLTKGNVLLITIEMSEKEYLDRLYSYFSLLNSSDIMNYRLSDREIDYIDESLEPMRKCGNHLNVVHMPEGCNITSIRNCVEETLNEMSVDLIIVDYLNIIRNDRGQIDYSWENQCTLATELKLKVAKAYNIAVWTGQQTSADGGGAFSKHIIDQLDCGVLLKKSKDFDDTGIVEGSFNKYRSFSPEKFKLDTYYQCSRLERPSDSAILKTKKVVRKRRITCSTK